MSKYVVLALAMTMSMFTLGCGDDKQDKKTIAPQQQQQQQAKAPLTFKVGNETVESEEKKVLGDKVVISVPKGFEKMPEDMLRNRFPNKQPDFVLTNKDATVEIDFAIMKKDISESQIKAATSALKKIAKQTNPTAQFHTEEVVTINNKQAGFFDYSTSDIYQKMTVFEMDGKILLVTFTCIKAAMKDWQSVTIPIIESIKIQ
ncbi:MAG: hypothetical protein ACRDBM_11780 [Sporomusa sp.]